LGLNPKHTINRMSEPLEIQTVAGPIRGRVRPPGSKSITNRALVCAALADGVSTLTGALDSEDTRVMIEGLGRLGIDVASHNAGTHLKVNGAGGEIPALEADIFCANSGTTIRFLTAVATLGHGSFRLDGVERMRQRPIGDLLAALKQLGAHAASENGDNCPPVVVHSKGVRGGTARLRGDISSQYLSGVLLAAPAARGPVELIIDGPLVSQPYVRMTLEVMKSFGVVVDTADDLQQFQVAAPQRYHACKYAIEPDASAASYFWAAAAICGGEITVEGLTANSLQGDVAFVDCLENMGCKVRRDPSSTTIIGPALRGIDVDMNAISDTVQTLAVVAVFADGPTRIRQIGHIRHKETDRIAAVAKELRKLGVDVAEHDDGVTIDPANGKKPLMAALIETYHDHRMAMSFALAGLRIPGLRIANPSCVEKTYPRFFEDLAELIR
jgi:3-phosphoshikimate 1-carboxyvinyltransferase